MGIVRFDPFREIDRLQNEVNRLFEGYTTPPGDRSASAAAARLWSPVVDVAENENEIVLRAELPGMKQEDIDIELTGDTLSIRGERKFESEDRKDNFVRVERSYGKFTRSFRLPETADTGKISAAFDSGVLHVTVPKRPTPEKKEPTKIPIAESK